MFDKIVIVTQKTRLEGLLERFNTRDQAKFWIEHMGLSFADYDREHAAYQGAFERVRREVEGLADKLQVVERSLLPNFLFTDHDLVVTVGRDGLVVNAAKYLDGQPIVAVNPDPLRWDGILLPFSAEKVKPAVVRALESRAGFHRITMAEVQLNDGQRLLAFNEFMIGQKTHVSARYALTFGKRTEEQSSSGVLVATGAGSTGWLSSTQNMAEAVSRLLLADRAPKLPRLKLAWDDPRLVFVVREPYLSKSSGVQLGAGTIEAGDALTLESHMPEGGVIFSDGVEADALEFNAGSVATIARSKRVTNLVSADAGAARKAA
jgi:NAD kinase